MVIKPNFPSAEIILVVGKGDGGLIRPVGKGNQIFQN